MPVIQTSRLLSSSSGSLHNAEHRLLLSLQLHSGFATEPPRLIQGEIQADIGCPRLIETACHSRASLPAKANAVCTRAKVAPNISCGTYAALRDGEDARLRGRCRNWCAGASACKVVEAIEGARGWIETTYADVSGLNAAYPSRTHSAASR
jgi:hypothetical protein